MNESKNLLALVIRYCLWYYLYMEKGRYILVAIFLLAVGAVCFSADSEQVDFVPSRLAVCSPWYYVSPTDIDLQASYCGFDPAQKKRIAKLSIGEKALDMIENADEVVLASVFLFDVLYAEGKPEMDIVSKLTDLLVKKRSENPDFSVVIMLDPINRAYNNRRGPAVKRLSASGADIFYSDLVSTNSATALGVGETLRDGLRLADNLSFGVVSKVLSVVASPKIPIKNDLDEDGISIEALWNAAAIKANHRKLLVTDSGDTYEALVSSANPHNASAGSANYSISVKGDFAKYIYMNIRADVELSIKLDYAYWSDPSAKYRESFLKDKLPAFKTSSYLAGFKSKKTPIGVRYITEGQIRREILRLLAAAKDDDEIRIQMFYLSDIEVVDAIADAAGRVKKPVRLILDPSKDAFGKIKDGTPNRQVAAYLMQKKKDLGLNIEIRWYDTHGEQNHAKIMSITNPKADKYEVITGSANWTGKNLKDINMESNVSLKDAKGVCGKFNGIFDKFWTNSDGLVYTIKYEGKYEKHAGMSKWLDGEKWGYVSW
ncbi:MAG: hypothetical protein K9M75_00260 [Phycisphaerae bacterium]|nr:hypothetical protein [Phycisphaerae bacterium]